MSSSADAPARSDEAFDYLFKVVLIGDSSVGKTCIVQRFKHDTFVEKHGNTIGVDFTIKTIDVDGKRVKVTRRGYLGGKLCFVRRLEVCKRPFGFWPGQYLYNVNTCMSRYI